MSSLDQLFNKGKIVTYRKKALIFSPKEKPQDIYKILQGYVVCYTLSSDKKRRIQTIIIPGDVFPILIHLKNIDNNIYCEALTTVKVKKISKVTFLSKINTDIAVTLDLLNLLSGYLSVYVNRVENLELENTQKKVVNRLLLFAIRFGIKHVSGYKIPAIFTHSLIAESINVSRENVTKEIAGLKKKKLLLSIRGEIIVPNLKALQDLL